MDYEKALREVRAWRLGQTSERHETSGRGMGTISGGEGDRGGKSYGAYQLSANSGTLQEYLEQSAFRRELEGLVPGSVEFDAKWRELARSHPEAFRHDQHDFIGRTHFEPQLARLDARGIHLRDRGIALQDALWSTSVQFRGITTTIVAKGIEEKFGEGADAAMLTDRQIIDAMQDYKIAHNNRFSAAPRRGGRGCLREHPKSATTCCAWKPRRPSCGRALFERKTTSPSCHPRPTPNTSSTPRP